MRCRQVSVAAQVLRCGCDEACDLIDPFAPTKLFQPLQELHHPATFATVMRFSSQNDFLHTDVANPGVPLSPRQREASATASVADASACAAARVILICQDARLVEQFHRVADETRATVMYADNAEAALRLFSRHPFDVAVIDTSLRSGHGGGDILESIRLHWGW